MRIEKEEQEKKVVEETLLAAYKENDSVFAADFDLELKRQRTEEQFKWEGANAELPRSVTAPSRALRQL